MEGSWENEKEEGWRGGGSITRLRLKILATFADSNWQDKCTIDDIRLFRHPRKNEKVSMYCWRLGSGEVEMRKVDYRCQRYGFNYVKWILFVPNFDSPRSGNAYTEKS